MCVCALCACARSVAALASLCGACVCVCARVACVPRMRVVGEEEEERGGKEGEREMSLCMGFCKTR